MICPYCGNRTGIVDGDVFECGQCEKHAEVPRVVGPGVTTIALGVALGILVAMATSGVLYGAWVLLRRLTDV